MVEIGAERHAIVLRLRSLRHEHLCDILETHMARYDAVVAFANPRPRKLLERLAAEHHWPKLVIRGIPKSR